MLIDLHATTETIWNALHAYREKCIPEGTPEHDAEWDDICGAMATLQEEAGCPEQVDDEWLIAIDAASAAEASALYCAARDESGEGFSTFPEGKWQGHRISYNGRVWQKPEDGDKAIYNPGGATPDYWADSTL